MDILGFYFSIWVYWVMHVGLVIFYGIFLLTRKYNQVSEGKEVK